MVSPLVTARNTIATIWEAATPPSDTAVVYHQVDGSTIPDGASARRCFYFPAPLGGSRVQYGRNTQVLEHEIEARLILTNTGRSAAELFEDIANEAVLLLLAINLATARGTSLGSGVDFMACDSYSVEQIDSGDVEVVFKIRVHTQES